MDVEDAIFVAWGAVRSSRLVGWFVGFIGDDREIVTHLDPIALAELALATGLDLAVDPHVAVLDQKLGFTAGGGEAEKLEVLAESDELRLTHDLFTFGAIMYG